MNNIKFWRYYVPNDENGEGWGIFLLDSTGMFAAVSDYGNCAFRWAYHGCSDFREFFKGGSWDYYLGKLFPGRDKELQSDETVREIKRYIIRKRWERYWTEDQARKEWELLEAYDNLYSKHDFHCWYVETSIDDAYEFAVYDYPASIKAFGYKLMPRFQKLIMEELIVENIQ